MYSIYQFFAHLLEHRRCLRELPKLSDLPWHGKPFAYKNFCGFPNLAMQYEASWPPYGGELVGLLESDSFSVPSFVSHIPTGAISLNALPQDTANHIRREIKALNPETQLPALHEVYYLLRGRWENRTKVCLVHGSFFATKEADQLVRRALAQVASDCLKDNDMQAVDPDAVEWLARTLSREVLLSHACSAPNASVSFRLEVVADVIDTVNILCSDRFPAIEADTLSFVIPYGLNSEFRERISGLRSSLLWSEWRFARKLGIRHPFNGDFFVLSFAL
jgi:hypothetical protein